MKTVITALIIVAEVTTYTDDGKVLTRPKPIQIEAFENAIPDDVLDWVRGKLPPEALGGK